MDGRLPEILFSGGEHLESDFPRSSLISVSEDNTAVSDIVASPTAEKSVCTVVAAGGRAGSGTAGKLDGFKCPRCGKLFLNFGLLKVHQQAAHQDTVAGASSPHTTRTRIFKFRKGGDHKGGPGEVYVYLPK